MGGVQTAVTFGMLDVLMAWSLAEKRPPLSLNQTLRAALWLQAGQ